MASHKPMPDHVWAERMRKFARDGVWPTTAGNKPSSANKKWHSIYTKIEKCPAHNLKSGQQTILAFVSKPTTSSKKCNCGYHNIRNLGSPSPAAPGIPGRSTITLETLPKQPQSKTKQAFAVPGTHRGLPQVVSRPSSSQKRSSSAGDPKTVEYAQEQQVKRTFPSYLEEKKGATSRRIEASKRHVMPRVVYTSPTKKTGSPQKMGPLMKSARSLYKQKQKPRQNVSCTVTSPISTNPTAESSLTPWDMISQSILDNLHPVRSDVSTVSSHSVGLDSTPPSITTSVPLTVQGLVTPSDRSTSVSSTVQGLVTPSVCSTSSVPSTVQGLVTPSVRSTSSVPSTVQGLVTPSVCSTSSAPSTVQGLVTPSVRSTSVSSTVQGLVTPSVCSTANPSLTLDSPAGRPITTTASTALSAPVSTQPPLPKGWEKSLPKEDHRWVSDQLIRADNKGRARLVRNLKLWWYPPAVTKTSALPTPGPYFTSPLLLWMPFSVWGCRFQCQFCGKVMTRAGNHRLVRQVLDVDGFYNMATERLECTTCNKGAVCWSQTLLQQLPAAYRQQFPVILTYRYACDVKVIRLMRERTAGNGPFRLSKLLKEQHTEKWASRTLLYLNDCHQMTQSPFVVDKQVAEPPVQKLVPTYDWLQTVYLQDILTRLDVVKPALTTVTGRVIKMDSTKRIVKKLAGSAKGTASWVTNIGNEKGEVLASVLTAGEGKGLQPLTQGIVKRFDRAGVSQPEVIYVDRDCCATHSRGSSLLELFKPWTSPICLDIWHFIRRFSTGCHTEAHPMYKHFLRQLSGCIFEWNLEDVDTLRVAVRKDLERRGRKNISSKFVDTSISTIDLAKHCRRSTRPVAEMEKRINALITMLDGVAGRDTLGFPLLDSDRIWSVWSNQKKHLVCIQDPPGVQLYTVRNYIMRGGVELPVFRCARGSTSLESFHLHLQKFIPGESANDVHFQAYLMEGLFRWNQDRLHSESGIHWKRQQRSYDLQLQQTVNSLGESVLGHSVFHNVQEIRPYTGELMGVEYLYRQTGKSFEAVIMDSENPQSDLPPMPEPVEETVEDILEEDLTVSDLVDITAVEETAIQDLFTSDEPETPVLSEPEPTTATKQSKYLRPDVSFGGIGPSQESKPHDVEPKVLFGGIGSSRESIPHDVGTEVSFGGIGSSQESIPHDVGTEVSFGGIGSSQESIPHDVGPEVSFGGIGSSQESIPHDVGTEVSFGGIGPSRESIPHDVGPDGAPGFNQVQKLAHYLVNIRHSPTLDSFQVSSIIRLWTALDDFDKQRVTYPTRSRQKHVTGRFKTPRSKTSTVTSGMESTKRSFVGPGVSAQKPDASRLVEAICNRLCEIHHSPKKGKGKGVSGRWSHILTAYKQIQALVRSSGKVMAETTIALFDINQFTLSQWFVKTRKQQEDRVLMQGVNMPARLPSPAFPVHVPVSIPSHHIPQEIASQSQSLDDEPVRKRLFIGKQDFVPSNVLKVDGGTIHVLPQTFFPQSFIPQFSQAEIRSSVRRKLRKDEGKRDYQRSKTFNTCRFCGKFKIAETGHSQIRKKGFAADYCPSREGASGLTVDQWKDRFLK